MSARKGFVSTIDVPCDGGESPNAYVPKITAQVRVHFPPNTVSEEEVLRALGEAYIYTRAQLEEFFA